VQPLITLDYNGGNGLGTVLFACIDVSRNNPSWNQHVFKPPVYQKLFPSDFRSGMLLVANHKVHLIISTAEYMYNNNTMEVLVFNTKINTMLLYSDRLFHVYVGVC